MILLKPEVHETIWGGSRLTPFSGSESHKIGHLYSVYQINGKSNKIINGEWEGRYFSDYFIHNRDKFGLSKYNEFPLIIALVDAKEHLSIQVHPDDEMAKKLESLPFGKNESWYFIEEPESGYIYDGCVCKNKKELEWMIENGEIEKATDTLKVKAGDYVYIEGGTLHALSAGALVYEIEENAEVTYRFYDFNRKDENGNLRPLQIKQALEAVHVNKKSYTRCYETEPIEERMYWTQKLTDIQEYMNTSSTLECITILDGDLLIDSGKHRITTGQTIILEPGDKIKGTIKFAIMARPKI